MMKRKRATVYRVRQTWVRACPGLTLRQWLTVSKRVRQRRIRYKDLVAIRMVAMEVKA